MKLTRIEVFNFRKLRRARLNMSNKQTLLVGANNSVKTSAMKALRKFLKDCGGIDTRDLTASNWAVIEQIKAALRATAYDIAEQRSLFFSALPHHANHLPNQ